MIRPALVLVALSLVAPTAAAQGASELVLLYESVPGQEERSRERALALIEQTTGRPFRGDLLSSREALGDQVPPWQLLGATRIFECAGPAVPVAELEASIARSIRLVNQALAGEAELELRKAIESLPCLSAVPSAQLLGSSYLLLGAAAEALGNRDRANRAFADGLAISGNRLTWDPRLSPRAKEAFESVHAERRKALQVGLSIDLRELPVGAIHVDGLQLEGHAKPQLLLVSAGPHLLQVEIEGRLHTLLVQLDGGRAHLLSRQALAAALVHPSGKVLSISPNSLATTADRFGAEAMVLVASEGDDLAELSVYTRQEDRVVPFDELGASLFGRPPSRVELNLDLGHILGGRHHYVAIQTEAWGRIRGPLLVGGGLGLGISPLSAETATALDQGEASLRLLPSVRAGLRMAWRVSRPLDVYGSALFRLSLRQGDLPDFVLDRKRSNDGPVQAMPGFELATGLLLQVQEILSVHAQLAFGYDDRPWIHTSVGVSFSL
jgi:hypothetical protein